MTAQKLHWPKLKITSYLHLMRDLQYICTSLIQLSVVFDTIDPHILLKTVQDKNGSKDLSYLMDSNLFMLMMNHLDQYCSLYSCFLEVILSENNS